MQTHFSYDFHTHIPHLCFGTFCLTERVHLFRNTYFIHWIPLYRTSQNSAGLSYRGSTVVGNSHMPARGRGSQNYAYRKLVGMWASKVTFNWMTFAMVCGEFGWRKLSLSFWWMMEFRHFCVDIDPMRICAIFMETRILGADVTCHAACNIIHL